jgi:hypothetical protein
MERLDDYLEGLLPGIDGELDIEMREDKENYYWDFDYDKRSYTLTINKETGEVKGESWREGTKAQYKKH